MIGVGALLLFLRRSSIRMSIGPSSVRLMGSLSSLLLAGPLRFGWLLTGHLASLGVRALVIGTCVWALTLASGSSGSSSRPPAATTRTPQAMNSQVVPPMWVEPLTSPLLEGTPQDVHPLR